METVVQKDVTIIGLPIIKESATDEFYNFFDKNNVVCVDASVGPLNQFGYEYLNTIGIKPIFANLWIEDNRRLGGHEVAKKLINFINNIAATKIAFLTPGSPYYFDSICQKIIKMYTVIDTKSSGQICYESLNMPFPINIIDVFNTRTNLNFLRGHVNVLSCLGEGYTQYYIKNAFLDNLSDDMKIFVSKITNVVDTQSLTLTEFIDILKNQPSTLNDKTILICLPN
jgi:hypothetical protein